MTIKYMPTLSHLNTIAAKPGAGFQVKGVGGFADRTQKAINSNLHGLGTLKKNEVGETAVALLNKHLVGKQHIIRNSTKPGLSKNQADALVHQVKNEANSAHSNTKQQLTYGQKQALEKLARHLTAQVKRPVANAPQKGITSLANAQQNKSSIKQIGDTTRMVHQGQTIRASGGIASSTRRNQLANNLGGINKPSSPAKPPAIKLSI
jgi:hypothetical protein